MDINETMLSAMDKLIGKVKDTEDPKELKEFNAFAKRAIPFGARKYVYAYLLKEYLKKNKVYTKSTIENGVSLFMGVGKNRRVYPKDIIHLFINTGKIEREQIGDIRILDNYSFITVSKEAADTVINNLNGINYRGRSLNINYAKKK